MIIQMDFKQLYEKNLGHCVEKASFQTSYIWYKLLIHQR